MKDRPRPDHKEPPVTTSRQAAIYESLSLEAREEIRAASKAYAVAMMERFERDQDDAKQSRQVLQKLDGIQRLLT